MNKFSELEYKWKADHLAIGPFNRWAMVDGPYLYRHVISPDFYWIQGDNVVRHRPNPGQLTVKCRKSKDSITDRVEVDLNFAAGIEPQDIDAFLEASGWRLQMTLFKDAHIYWYRLPDHTITLALYDVENEKKKRQKRFLEVEVEKSSNVDDKAARRILDEWLEKLTYCFKLQKPLNQSLYEIYSGKKYKIHKGD